MQFQAKQPMDQECMAWEYLWVDEKYQNISANEIILNKISDSAQFIGGQSHKDSFR